MLAGDSVSIGNEHIGQNIIYIRPEDLEVLQNRNYDDENPDNNQALRATYSLMKTNNSHTISNFIPTDSPSVLFRPIARELAEQNVELINEYRSEVREIKDSIEKTIDIVDKSVDTVMGIHQKGFELGVDAIEATVNLHGKAVNVLTDGIEITVDTAKDIHQKGVALGVDAIEATVNLHEKTVNALTDGIEMTVDTAKDIHQKGVALGVDAIEATVNFHGKTVNALTDGIEMTVDTAKDIHQKGVALGVDAIEATVNTVSKAGDYLQERAGKAKDYLFGKTDESSGSNSQAVDNPQPENRLLGTASTGDPDLDRILEAALNGEHDKSIRLSIEVAQRPDMQELNQELLAEAHQTNLQIAEQQRLAVEQQELARQQALQEQQVTNRGPSMSR